MDPKHIVIDAREYSSSSGRYVRKLLQYLEELDHTNKYTVLIQQKDTSEYQPRAANFTSKVVDFPKFSLAEQTTFAHYLRSLQPDLVHFAFAQQPLAYRGKKVTTIHDLTPLHYNLALGWKRAVYPIKQLLFNAVLRAAAKTSSQVIVPTEYVKNEVIKQFGVSPSLVQVTHESADQIVEPASAVQQLHKQRFLLYVGRVQPHKNISRLIDAVQILQQTDPDLHLVLAGKKDAAYTHLEQQIEKQKVPNIYLTGFVTDAELRWLYQNCAAYVFPSLSEGFGLPGLEAMLHGAPVVSSNASCLPEVSGNAALYFNPLNVEDIATKIERVLQDKTFRKQLIARGMHQAGLYSWKRMTQQTLDVYKQVLED